MWKGQIPPDVENVEVRRSRLQLLQQEWQMTTSVTDQPELERSECLKPKLSEQSEVRL